MLLPVQMKLHQQNYPLTHWAYQLMRLKTDPFGLNILFNDLKLVEKNFGNCEFFFSLLNDIVTHCGDCVSVVKDYLDNENIAWIRYPKEVKKFLTVYMVSTSLIRKVIPYFSSSVVLTKDGQFDSMTVLDGPHSNIGRYVLYDD
jgi:hypothetical protein